jgi:hypothetical protein
MPSRKPKPKNGRDRCSHDATDRGQGNRIAHKP